MGQAFQQSGSSPVPRWAKPLGNRAAVGPPRPASLPPGLVGLPTTCLLDTHVLSGFGAYEYLTEWQDWGSRGNMEQSVGRCRDREVVDVQGLEEVGGCVEGWVWGSS